MLGPVYLRVLDAEVNCALEALVAVRELLGSEPVDRRGSGVSSEQRSN